MSDISPRLSLPFLMPSQAQKHVTHNEALERLDALVQLSVLAFDATQPPASPTQGDIHAIGTGAADAWAGHDGQLGLFTDTGWSFIPPQQGWRAWGVAEAELRVYSGGTWLSVMPPLHNLDGVGIGASWDSTNRLAVASDASLLSHSGAGHQLKVSPDGTTFHDALQVRRADGVTLVPCLMSGRVSIMIDSVVSIPTPGAGG